MRVAAAPVKGTVVSKGSGDGFVGINVGGNKCNEVVVGVPF